MNELIFFANKVLVNGTVLGSVYALGAIGVTLIFGILRFAHFAHGDMMTMGAFVAFALAAHRRRHRHPHLLAAGLHRPAPGDADHRAASRWASTGSSTARSGSAAPSR